MNTGTHPLTYQQLLDTIAKLLPHIPSIQLYYTPYATKEKTIARTWKERLFSLPWRPWQRDNLQYQPAIYLVNIPSLPSLTLPHLPQRNATLFIAHPSFKHAIEKGLKDQPPWTPKP